LAKNDLELYIGFGYTKKRLDRSMVFNILSIAKSLATPISYTSFEIVLITVLFHSSIELFF